MNPRTIHPGTETRMDRCFWLHAMRDAQHPYKYDPVWVCVRDDALAPCPYVHGCMAPREPRVWCPWLEGKK